MSTESDRKLVLQYGLLLSVSGTVLFFFATMPMGLIAAAMGCSHFLLGPLAALMLEARGDFTVVPWLVLLYVPMMFASVIRLSGLTVVVSIAGFVLWHATGVLVFFVLMMRNMG